MRRIVRLAAGSAGNPKMKGKEAAPAAPFFVAILVVSATFREKSRRPPGEEKRGILPRFGGGGAGLPCDGTAPASLGQPTR